VGTHAQIRLRQGLGALALVVVLLVLPGCGGDRPGAEADGGTVGIAERDFAISAPKQLSSGDIVLQVHNRGPDQHELIVARVNASGLPFRADGLTIDEEALARHEAGALEPGESGSVRDLPLHLTPGRYVLFCNMSGHYLGGMHSDLVVRQ
jgi:uncharacterized cupredoxin-like copper-binding protein